MASEITKAKVFMSGRSQAVRIPAEFRFKTKEVFIRRAPDGDIVLSSSRSAKKTLKEVFAMLDESGVPDDFLTDRDTRPAEERDTL